MHLAFVIVACTVVIGILVAIAIVAWTRKQQQAPADTEDEITGQQATLLRIRSRTYNLLQSENGVDPDELMQVEDDNMKDIRHMLAANDTLTGPVLAELYSSMALLRPQALAARHGKPHDVKLSESLAAPLAEATVTPDIIYKSIQKHQAVLNLGDISIWKRNRF